MKLKFLFFVSIMLLVLASCNNKDLKDKTVECNIFNVVFVRDSTTLNNDIVGYVIYTNKGNFMSLMSEADYLPIEQILMFYTPKEKNVEITFSQSIVYKINDIVFNKLLNLKLIETYEN